jgi:hypothetical protein
MATVTPTFMRDGVVRSGSAQADVGQTDWIAVPRGARFATVVFNLTAAAGTTPVTNLTVRGLTGSLDDANAYHLTGTTLTAQNTTATSGLVQIVDIGPGIGTTDLILGATGVNQAVLNCPLPQYLGLGLAFDRTSANETYTYTLTVRFS